MEKLKKFFTSVPGLILVFTIAAVPLVFGSIGSARAALTYYSETYASQVEMHDIGVSLIENGTVVQSWRDYESSLADGTWNENTGVLLSNMLAEDNGQLKFGKGYQEALSAKNTGNIDEYVRATIYKYWVDPQGKKTYVLSPNLIDINVTPVNGWVEDTSARTDERIVLYYTNILPVGQTSPAFTDTLTIKGDVKGNVKVEKNAEGYTVTTYDYNGYKFILQCDIDAVQTHNAEPAITSAWGKTVNITNGVITGGITSSNGVTSEEVQ